MARYYMQFPHPAIKSRMGEFAYVIMGVLRKAFLRRTGISGVQEIYQYGANPRAQIPVWVPVSEHIWL